MFSRQLRHISRYREIARILANEGFGYLIEETDLITKIPYHDKLRPNTAANLDLGERICITLQQLGPTYIKLGQIASTRPDLLPKNIITHLEKLQDSVPSFSYEEAAALIREELGAEADEIFSEFDHEAIATASIGQVHLGRLKTGEKVAIKLQRPHITETIETDLDILFHIATAAQKRFQWARDYQLADIIDEFSKSLLKELNYIVEARNTEKMTALFKGHKDVYAPNIFWDYSTRKVLTLEYLDGIKINQTETLTAQGYDCPLIAKRFAESMFQQIFIDGYFHGDPHPGNILVLPNNVIGFLDFGMVGRLNSDVRDGLASLLIGLRNNDTRELLRAILRLGDIPNDINIAELQNDIEAFCDNYYGMPLSKVSVGEAANTFFGLAQKHNIRMPADLVMVGKALLTVEGIVRTLSPELALTDIVEPFGRRLLLERFKPKKVLDSFWQTAAELRELLHHIPQDIQVLRTLIDQGHMQVRISMSDTEILLKRLAQFSNRLSVSIMLLAFSILMGSIVLSFSIMGRPSTLWNFPVVESGFFIAFCMFLWVLYAIFRSGKL